MSTKNITTEESLKKLHALANRIINTNTEYLPNQIKKMHEEPIAKEEPTAKKALHRVTANVDLEVALDFLAKLKRQKDNFTKWVNRKIKEELAI